MLNDAHPVLLKIYVDGFDSPEIQVVRFGSLCNQAIDGLVDGDFWQIVGRMRNGQKFIMRKKETYGRETKYRTLRVVH